MKHIKDVEFSNKLADSKSICCCKDCIYIYLDTGRKMFEYCPHMKNGMIPQDLCEHPAKSECSYIDEQNYDIWY